MNLPVVTMVQNELPIKGEFRRYGLDLLVLSCWRTLQQAKCAGDVLTDFLRLFRAAPFDVKYLESGEAGMTERANLGEAAEATREFLRPVRAQADAACG